MQMRDTTAVKTNSSKIISPFDKVGSIISTSELRTASRSILKLF